MNYVDNLFKHLIQSVMNDGVMSENARPKYEDGTVANSKYITSVFTQYDLSKGEFPITTLRQIGWKSAIKELFVIYQDQKHDVESFKKRGVHWWKDWSLNEQGDLGQRYGATVAKYDIMNKLLNGLEQNPWNRRNIINLWQYEDFEETDGLLPCAFQTMFDVRKVGEDMYLDCTLVQRSSDMLVAFHINEIQYVALQMMIAKHFGWKLGKFTHLVNNLHIYDNQFEQAKELLSRNGSLKSPRLVLNVPDKTNFYDIKVDDFQMMDYEPVQPNLKFDLAV